MLPSQPYLTFRLRIANKEKTTIATQKGQSVLAIVLAVLSLIGGLFTSISAVASMAVATLTKTAFITLVTKNLFLVKRVHPSELPNKEFEAEAAQKKISAENYERYCKLKKQIFENKVDHDDIEQINEVMNTQMGTLECLTRRTKFKLYSLLEPVIVIFTCRCCKKKSGRKSTFDI